MTEKIKTTAPVLSVGADREQPNTKNHKEIIANETAQINLQAAQNPEKSRSGGLQTVSMTELYDTVYPPRTPVVDGFLYGGTYLFVGAPKVGKSFFMGQLAYHVAMGLPLWDYPVRKGTVLYLALEDDYARLQQRLSRMFGIDVAEHFYFATRSKNLNEGLEEQLKEFLVAHADTRLVIIDTLQKIKEISGDKFSYANDYDIITKLKHFADEHNICILVVHHTRKMDSSDAFEMISGTNGLLGAADGAFIMQKEKRTDLKATVDITGRDQQDQKLYLKFDPKLCLWKFEKAETELWKEPEDKVLSAVNTYLMEAGCFQGTASELMDKIQEINLVPNQLTRQLNIKAGRLYEDYGIRYDNKRCHDGRIITLEYEKE